MKKAHEYLELNNWLKAVKMDCYEFVTLRDSFKKRRFSEAFSDTKSAL